MKILLITLLLALPVAAQEATSGITQKRLAKVLDVLDKTEAVVKAQNAELEAKNAVIAAKEAQIKAQDTQIAFINLSLKAREEEVTALRSMRCSTTSFLFGLLKRKSCS